MGAEHTIRTRHERQLASGLLSANTTYRLLVTGDFGPAEMDRVIRIMKLQKQVLEETEPPADLLPHLAWYCPPHLIIGA